MDVNRNAHPDCVHSDNPFHECASACLERIAQGQVKKNKKKSSNIFRFSRSLGRKKKDSRSQPLSTRPYQNGGGGFANFSSPMVDKETIFSSSSSAATNDFLKHKPEKNFSQNTHIFPRQEHNGKIEAGGERTLFSFLDSLRSNATSDDYTDDDEESNTDIGVELDLESVMSDTFVSVGKYRVRSGSSTFLTAIIEKHGDIAQNCKLESSSMRSRYLECLCSLMQELRSTPVGQLTKLKVKEMLAVLKDLESVNIKVAWLRSVLEEFARDQEDVETEKGRQDSLLKVKKEELEAQEADLVRMEEEVANVRLRIKEKRARVVEMEKSGFKMETFKGKSFIDELL